MENYLNKHQNLIKDFIKYCKIKGINLTEENFDYDGLCLYAKMKNIVLALNDKITIDDDLISWNILKKHFSINKSNPNFLIGVNYALLLHPFFSILDIFGYSPSLIDVLWDIGVK